jgi:hypothetical protein
MRQPTPVSFSTLTGWEAPDPNWWVTQGYAVVNCDLRGAGTSDGVGRDSPTLIADLAWSELFSESVDRFLRIAPERRRRAGFHARRKFQLGGDSAKDPRGSPRRRRCMSQDALRSELSPLRSRTAISGTPPASVSDLRRGPGLVHAYPRLPSKGILFGERDVKMPAPLFRLILSDIRELIPRFRSSTGVVTLLSSSSGPTAHSHQLCGQLGVAVARHR